MRILDEFDAEIAEYDLSIGYLTIEQKFIQHHDATESDEAWDEYENVQRYILYTEEELAEMKNQINMPTTEDRIAALEAALLELMGVTVDG